jgi:hypothetical protein
MDDLQDIQRELKRLRNLDLFLNGTEDKLSERLKPIEEFDGTNPFSVSDYTESPLSGFHPETIRMALKNDEYFLGCRANHFVLIFGTTEADEYFFEDCVVCLANHKGGLQIRVFAFVEEDDNPES